jgi:hypothetical protein
MRNWIPSLFLSICLVSQALAADVLGWQETRWGMTEEQAAASLGKEGRRVAPPEKFKGLYVPLKATVEISGHKLDALLQFSDQTKTLRQVLLRATTDSLELWAKLRDLLAEKYGPPSQSGKVRLWKFKTTVIELDRLSIPGVIGQVTVRYYPASEYQDEKQKL